LVKRLTRYLRMKYFCWIFVLFLGGCSGAASPVSQPDWDPSGISEKAMELFDSDGDGFLAGDELTKSPGLLAGLDVIDTDDDQKVSAAEIVARFDLYESKRLGLRDRRFRVTYNGKPLADANVKLVPEPFLEGVIEPATGVSRHDGTLVPNAGVDGLPGLRPGYYRIEVTSDKIKLPAKYNSETILGAEVSPGNDDPSPFTPKPVILTD
jgi:hypothetical protein